MSSYFFIVYVIKLFIFSLASKIRPQACCISHVQLAVTLCVQVFSHVAQLFFLLFRRKEKMTILHRYISSKMFIKYITKHIYFVPNMIYTSLMLLPLCDTIICEFDFVHAQCRDYERSVLII